MLAFMHVEDILFLGILGSLSEASASSMQPLAEGTKPTKQDKQH